MKKNIIVLLVLLITCFCIATLCGCQGGCNKDIIDWQYAYTRAYVKIGNEWKDIAIKQWTDYEGEQIQITLYDNSKILTSSINCILYYGKLP